MAFFQSAVKAISFQLRNEVEPAHTHTILDACSGVTDVAFHDDTSHNVYLQPLPALPNLTRLEAHMQSLLRSSPAFDFTHEVFRNITHLELLDHWRREHHPWSPRLISSVVPGLLLIPQLTRIAFGHPVRFTDYAILLQESRLQCIIVVFPENRRDSREVLIHDRMILTGDDRALVCFRQRVRRTRGGIDYWQMADAFIAAKRSGAIDRSWWYITADFVHDTP
ncbi:hypothetical protein DFH06DRAFT_53973 [Mycena polygramma]|nr:hypothetical protein DFH06DRAFT_53973 [Mycena polygramma]